MRYSTELIELGGTYVPYYKWECWKNGMYRKDFSRNDIETAKSILCSRLIKDKMSLVTDVYPVSALHHLSKSKSNRRSWIGQAAVFIDSKVVDLATRQAWMEISESDRRKANKSAEEIIIQWDMKNTNQLFLF
jgi:hypothetical protein